MSAPKIRKLSCVRCRFYSGRTKRFPSKAAVFYHLLWHRDQGDVVPVKLLDRFDPDIQDLDNVPRKGDIPRRNQSPISGNWGTCNLPVYPEKLGKVRGRVRRASPLARMSSS